MEKASKAKFIIWSRLRRWSFLSCDAMAMFFFLPRCDIDYFWRYPTIAIAAIIFPNNRDRLFCDGFFKFLGPMVCDVIWGKQKNTYFVKFATCIKPLHYTGCFLNPGPIKCFCASQHQILAKSASQKARNRDNALFTTNMRKSSINYVNVNHEQ